jgi:large subunit ribosomal protein L29
MKYADIKDLPNNELNSRLREERRMLDKLKFAHGVSTLENPGKIAESKKTIARLITEMNSRRIANQVKGEE